MGSRDVRTIAARATHLRKEVRGAVVQRHGSLLAQHDVAAIVLGSDPAGRPVTLGQRTRLEHTSVVGSTGGGKTKLLEQMIRQTILTGAGLLVMDPHGNHPHSLYRSVLCWMEREGLTERRRIHLIDPNAGSHVTGFNPLALPDETYDPAVVADAVLEAIERLWGEEDMNAKPTLQRLLTAVVTALCELELTLAEINLLFDDPDDALGIRAWMIGELQNETARSELQWLDGIASEPRGRAEYRIEVTGPRNRLAKLTHLESLALMIGQQDRTIDFRAALDGGDVILANLSPGPRVSDKAAQLLGRLLLRTVFFHAQRRERPDKAFFLFADECHLFLSGDVARLLSEIRKFGIGCVLSHQMLSQLEAGGLELLDAVKNNTNIKIVFRSRDTEEAAALAEMVIPFDLERPVKALVKPAVVGHRIRRMHSESASEQLSTTLTRGRTRGQGESIARARSRSSTQSQGRSNALSSNESFSWNEGWNQNAGASTAHSSSSSETAGRSISSSRSDSFKPPPDPPAWPMSLLVEEEEPVHLGMTIGQSAQMNASQSVGASASVGRSASFGTSEGYGGSAGSARTTGRSVGTAATQGETSTRGYSFTDSTSVSRGESAGTTRGSGVQEALEPLYQSLPGGVHSLENMRYLAGQLIRGLPTGQAIVSFVGANGPEQTALEVAHVESAAASPQEFEALRSRIFERSPSASRVGEARAHVARRRELLMAEARKAAERTAEPPASYRNKKKRPPAPARTDANAAGDKPPKRSRTARGESKDEGT